MGQLTIRAPDSLIDRIRVASAARGSSMNDYVATVLAAATDPDLAGSEAARIRERLALAGLVETPAGPARPRPDRARVAVARAKAGRGTPLSELVWHGRE